MFVCKHVCLCADSSKEAAQREQEKTFSLVGWKLTLEAKSHLLQTI